MTDVLEKARKRFEEQLMAKIAKEKQTDEERRRLENDNKAYYDDIEA